MNVRRLSRKVCAFPAAGPKAMRSWRLCSRRPASILRGGSASSMPRAGFWIVGPPRRSAAVGPISTCSAATSTGPTHAFDAMGLVLLFDRREVVGVDAEGADLVTVTGARQRFRRRQLPNGTVSLWELA